MRYFFILLVLNGTITARAEILGSIPNNVVKWTDFIPKGYDTLLTAKGDLNKDGKEDIVLALKSNKETDSLPRILLVAFKKDKGYELIAKSDKAILCKECGGIYGDPFESISVKKGVIILTHYGGSAWRWGYTHKFRYQNNNMYEIGVTSWSYWNGDYCEELGEHFATEYRDHNLITGDYVYKKVAETECKLLVNKKAKQPVKPLRILKEFSIRD